MSDTLIFTSTQSQKPYHLGVFRWNREHVYQFVLIFSVDTYRVYIINITFGPWRSSKSEHLFTHDPLQSYYNVRLLSQRILTMDPQYANVAWLPNREAVLTVDLWLSFDFTNFCLLHYTCLHITWTNRS